MSLTTRLVRRKLDSLTLLEVNARYMRKEVYDNLVGNLRQDGVLTSTPLIYSGDGEYAEGAELVLSGNHRVKAAIEAGIDEADFILIDQRLPKAKQLALQLSHNAIEGEDDLSVLKQLYESIDTVEDRTFAGLDDRTLELLQKVDAESLGEVDLNWHIVQIVFLPPEAEKARKALDQLGTSGDERWLAAYKDYEALLDSLASVHDAHNVGNLATAFGILIELAESHLTDLQDGFLDPDGRETRNHGGVGLEVVLGSRVVPPSTAAALTRALRTAINDGKVDAEKPHQLLDLLIANYLDVQS